MRNLRRRHQAPKAQSPPRNIVVTEHDHAETADPQSIDLEADQPLSFQDAGLRFLDDVRQEVVRRRLSYQEVVDLTRCPDELVRDLFAWQPGGHMPWCIAWCLALEAVATCRSRTLRALGKRNATEELHQVLDRALVPSGWNWEHVRTRLVRPQCPRVSELTAETEFAAVCGLLDRVAGGLGMAIVLAAKPPVVVGSQ